MSQSTQNTSPAVTFRAIILGVLFIPPTCYWSIQRGLIWGGPPTTLSLIYTTVCALFGLTILNVLIIKIFSRRALNQGELLTIYIMICLASVIGGFDILQVLMPVIGHVFWFATPENEWRQLFWPHLPEWLVVSDRAALKGFFEGDSTLYVAEHVNVWFPPLLWWSGFLLTLTFVMLCFTVLVRKQWTEHEKLTYPIMQLPVAMTQDGGIALLRNHVLWIGFLVAGAVDTINSLHRIYPVIPEIPIRNYELSRYFTEKPLSGMGITRVAFFPFGIGLAFLMPLDLSFSCWFFFWYWKVLRIFFIAIGWRMQYPEFAPYAVEQTFGSYVSLGVIALFWTWKHIRQSLTAKLRTTAEPVPPRLALFGIIAGVALLAIFCAKAGVTAWIAFIMFIVYLLISLSITRMRAELGPPSHELYSGGPERALVSILGSRRLGATNISVFALLWGIFRAQRCHPMPHQLEAFKMAERSNFPAKPLVFAMIIALIFGLAVSCWLLLDTGYQEGYRLGFGWEAFGYMEKYLVRPEQTDASAVIAMCLGFIATLFIRFMRLRFLWWPLNPIAYPLSATDWAIRWTWACCLISWAIKSAILRYGGLKVYRQVLPFFLGLLLGEFVIGGLWSLLGMSLHIPTYNFWH
ncbi:hypothetical protein FJZ31_27430 [Candidatus Poribacteria bacterium]|nr:hypothetical protein [Candidatus Poribacteria bacterium]